MSPARAARRLHVAAGVTARCAEGRAQDRRAELMESSDCSKRSSRVRGRGSGVRSIRPRCHDLRLKPEAGVKYSKVTGLSDDLASPCGRMVRSTASRKSTVVFDPEPESRGDAARAARIRRLSAIGISPLTLGKTIHGEPYVTDLHRCCICSSPDDWHRQVGRPELDADQPVTGQRLMTCLS